MAAAAPRERATGRAARLAALLAPLAVLALTALVLAPSLRGEFVSWDDDQAFVDNPRWRGLSAENVRWALVTRHLGPWQPLAWLSLQLDHELWGPGPFGPHLGNLVLHALTAAAACVLARRLLALALPAAAPRWRELAAALAALLFALHPLRVESVAWATERRDPLSGLLVVLTTLAWLRAARTSGGARRLALVATAALHALALASKATAVPVPLVLLVLAHWPLRIARASGGTRSLASLLAELAPLLALSLAAGLVALVGQAEAGAFVDARALGLLDRLRIACHACAFYLARSLWPGALWPHYALPADLDFAGARFTLALVLVPAGLMLAWLARRRAPALATGAACALLLVLPVSGLAQVGRQLAADRYTYLPGLVLALLAAGAWLRALERPGAAARGLRPVLVGLALLVVVALSLRSRAQVGIWRDSERLWRHVLAHEPDSVPARNNVANLLVERGDDAGALEHYRAAARLAPAEPRIRTNLARALERLGRLPEAIAEAERACELGPEQATSWLLAGTLRLRAGEPALALDRLREARRLAPRLVAVRVRAAEAWVALGRGAEGQAELAEGLELAEDGELPPRRGLEAAARLARSEGWTALAARADALLARSSTGSATHARGSEPRRAASEALGDGW